MLRKPGFLTDPLTGPLTQFSTLIEKLQFYSGPIVSLVTTLRDNAPSTLMQA
jgi:hypothetical protein